MTPRKRNEVLRWVQEVMSSFTWNIWSVSQFESRTIPSTVSAIDPPCRLLSSTPHLFRTALFLFTVIPGSAVFLDVVILADDRTLVDMRNHSIPRRGIYENCSVYATINWRCKASIEARPTIPRLFTLALCRMKNTLPRLIRDRGSSW